MVNATPSWNNWEAPQEKVNVMNCSDEWTQQVVNQLACPCKNLCCGNQTYKTMWMNRSYNKSSTIEHENKCNASLWQRSTIGSYSVSALRYMTCQDAAKEALHHKLGQRGSKEQLRQLNGSWRWSVASMQVHSSSIQMPRGVIGCWRYSKHTKFLLAGRDKGMNDGWTTAKYCSPKLTWTAGQIMYRGKDNTVCALT